MAQTGKRPKKTALSRTSLMHYGKLVFRSLLFLAVLLLYVADRVQGRERPLEYIADMPALLIVIWVVFAFEMLLRFFPAPIESMGCRKQFARNFRPTGAGTPELRRQINQGLGITVAAWILLNGAIGALYRLGILDGGILLLISLAYSVCDMICILFFCPFQTWFMKNKCCTTCRIYNWDYAMMFTPMLFLGNFYGLSLLAIALALLIQWEVLAWLHPERFSQHTNESLACQGCTEKLCHHKKQLRSFWRKNRAVLIAKGNAFLSERRKKD